MLNHKKLRRCKFSLKAQLIHSYGSNYGNEKIITAGAKNSVFAEVGQDIANAREGNDYLSGDNGTNVLLAGKDNCYKKL